MSDATSYLVSQVAKLKAAVDAIASWRWATVTSVDPLRVTPDGDTSPLVEAPDTLVSGLVVGDRVRLAIVARRALILGRARGGAPRLWVTMKSSWSYSAPTSQTAIPINGAVSVDISASLGWANESNGMTVPAAGWYLLNASVSYRSNSTGRRGCGVLVNGDSVGGSLLPTNSLGTTTISAPTTQALLAAGDRLQVYSQQESGDALAISGFTLSAVYVGPA